MADAAASISISAGGRIVVRGEEWLVRRMDQTPSGAKVFTVSGLTPLVRNREAKFIDAIEAEFGEVRGFIVDREERAGGAEVGRDGGASRGSGEQQDRREFAIHDRAPLGGKYPISGGESPMFKCGAAHSGGAWKRARARR